MFIIIGTVKNMNFILQFPLSLFFVGNGETKCYTHIAQSQNYISGYFKFYFCVYKAG
jgi:hypothetical protein